MISGGQRIRSFISRDVRELDQMIARLRGTAEALRQATDNLKRQRQEANRAIAHMRTLRTESSAGAQRAVRERCRYRRV
jgi:prefoldin subunit 5